MYTQDNKTHKKPVWAYFVAIGLLAVLSYSAPHKPIDHSATNTEQAKTKQHASSIESSYNYV